MILVYSSLLFLLGSLKFLVNRRVGSLEKKYGRTAAAADQLNLEETACRKLGSGHKLDSCEAAKRQYLLGQLVQKRDALESKHHHWLIFADKFGTVIARLREWRGRKLPYTMGALDVSGVMYLIDHYGLSDQANVQNLLQWVNTLIQQ